MSAVPYSLNLSTHPVLNVVIAYDGFLSGQHAVQTYQRLMLEQGEPVEVRLKTWAFGLLQNQKLNEDAIDDAAEAEVIIIAAESEELPAAVETWLEGWRERPPNNHRASVVAILNSQSNAAEHASPMEEFLRSLASSTGSELLLERAAAR